MIKYHYNRNGQYTGCSSDQPLKRQGSPVLACAAVGGVVCLILSSWFLPLVGIGVVTAALISKEAK